MRRLLALFLALFLSISSDNALALHTVEKRSAATALASPGLLVIDQGEKKVLSENKPDSFLLDKNLLLISTEIEFI